MALRLRISRFLPFRELAYHHVLMIVILITIVFSCLVLSGCTSNASLIPELYVLSMKYHPGGSTPTGSTLVHPQTLQLVADQVPSNATLQVNIGYFGICYTLEQPNYVCSRNINWLAEQLEPNQDPLNLIWQGQRFKNHVLWSPFFFISIGSGAVVLFLLATFPGWHKETGETGSDIEIKPFPSRPVSQVALALSSLSSLLLLASAIWTHVGAVAFAEGARALAPVNVQTSLGPASLAFNWIAFSMMTLTSMALLIMILSIRLLDQLTDDFDDLRSYNRPHARSPSPPTKETKQFPKGLLQSTAINPTLNFTDQILPAPPPPPPPMDLYRSVDRTSAARHTAAAVPQRRWDGDE